MNADVKTSQTIMTSTIYVHVIALICTLTLFCFADEQDETRWWQREELKPSTNQMINLDYLSKKRGLEIMWDRRNAAQRAIEYFGPKGQNINSIRESLRDINKKIGDLEEELKNIPQYITLSSLNSESKQGEVSKKKETQNIDETSTYGNKIMFRLNLSKWSYSELVEFTNEFDTNNRVRFFGVRVFPTSYVLSQFTSFDRWTQMGVPLSKVASVYTVHAPELWPANKEDRLQEICKLENFIIKGEPIFIPLFYDNDEVSISLPEGLYFLNYAVVLENPTRFTQKTIFGTISRIENNSYGPYYLKVTGSKQNIVQFMPKPREIEHDELENYFLRLKEIGVESLISEAMASFCNKKENTDNKQQPENKKEVYIRCTGCGRLNPEDANYCNKCGKRLTPPQSKGAEG